MQDSQTAPSDGTPQQSLPHAPPPESNIMAIIGLVAAILGLLLCWVTFAGLAISVVGLVLSIMGSKKANQIGGAGKGPAIGGIVVAIFGVLIGGAMTTCQLACAAAVHSAGGDLDRLSKEWEQAGEQFGKEFEKAMQEAQKQMEQERQRNE